MNYHVVSYYDIDFDDKKMKHSIHVSSDYFNGNEIQYYESGHYNCTCDSNGIFNWISTYLQIDYLFLQWIRIGFQFIMKLISSYQKTQSKNGDSWLWYLQLKTRNCYSSRVLNSRTCTR